MIIRSATPLDAHELSWAVFNFDLRRDEHYMLIAEDGGRPIGYVLAYRQPSRVSLLEVHPDRRREGVGRALVDAVQAEQAICVVGDEPCAFWRAMGFEYDASLGEAEMRRVKR